MDWLKSEAEDPEDRSRRYQRQRAVLDLLTLCEGVRVFHASKGKAEDITALRNQIADARLDPTRVRTSLLRQAKSSIELLWHLRRRADYDFDNPFTDDDAERAMERAEAVFSRADTTLM